MGIQTIHGTHKINAWADNNRTFAVTTGEGGIKYLQFILCDNKEEIYLGGTPTISYVITKPNGQSASVLVEIVDESNGLVRVPIQDNLTGAPGLVRGEIRVVTADGVLKFYGINLCVFKGANNDAPMASEKFDDLVKVLQKVSTILDTGTEGTVTLDNVISTDSQYTNPVASRVIAQFLIDNYEPKIIMREILPKPSDGISLKPGQLCLALKEGTNNEFDFYRCGNKGTGDSYIWYPVAKDKIKIFSSDVPPTPTDGAVESFWVDKTESTLYYCDEQNQEGYNWIKISGGGTGGATGKDGRGIENAEINKYGQLVLTYSDKTTDNVGTVVGASSSIGVKETNDGYELTINNDINGAVTTEYITVKHGQDGEDGDDGYTPVKGVDYFTESDKAEFVEEIKDSLGDIPDYWQDNLDTAVNEIRRAMENAGRNKSAFFFYSDAHWSNDTTYTSKLAPALLKYLYKNTPINQTNFGGDIVSAESSSTDVMTYLWDWRSQLRDLPNHHSVIGNHDDGNTTNNLFSEEYIYAYLFAPEENNNIVWGDGFYYYIDNNSEKTRYLYLDIFYDGMSDNQQAFVKQALVSTPEAWHIVVICHAWFANDYSVYPPVLNGFATEIQPLLNMFDSYNSRSGDYSNCKGYVELCIGGHYHLDHYEHTDGGIPVIIVEADTLHDRSGTMPQKGTTDEAAVSAVICDYNSKKVKVIRVGRGNSFTIDMASGELTTYYSIANDLTNVTSSSTLTQIEENTAYSTILTATVGVLTSVVVTMGGTDVTSSTYDESTNTIAIPAVTGNIVITAIAKAEESDVPYTNVIKTSIGTDGEIFNNGLGWADNSRIGSGGIYLGTANDYVTGHIPLATDESGNLVDNTFYLKNITFDTATTNTNVGIAFFKEDFTRCSADWKSPSDIVNNGGMDEILDGTNLIQFTVTAKWHMPEGAKYIAFCTEYIGNDSIITINEPIEQ